MPGNGTNQTGPDPSSGTGQPDPAEAVAQAVRDFWGIGAATLQAAATPQGSEDQGDAFRNMAAPVAGMLGAYADMMARLAGGPGGPADGTRGHERQATVLSPALVEAASVAMGSAVRYGQGLSEVFARHQGSVAKLAAARMSDDAEVRSDAVRAEAEAFRAFLRDVSETAMLEARRLEHELSQVSEAVAQAVAPDSSGDPFKRRCAVKP